MAENAKFKIGQVYSGSPAEKAGLKTGDVISRINGEPLEGLTLEQVNSRARGQSGTTVTLSILRANQAMPKEISVTRGNVKLDPAIFGDSK